MITLLSLHPSAPPQCPFQYRCFQTPTSVAPCCYIPLISGLVVNRVPAIGEPLWGIEGAAKKKSMVRTSCDAHAIYTSTLLREIITLACISTIGKWFHFGIGIIKLNTNHKYVWCCWHRNSPKLAKITSMHHLFLATELSNIQENYCLS